MSALKDEVIHRTLRKVTVVYVNRDVLKLWNERRKPDDTRTFSGWYWLRGTDEAGPFKTQSAATRDAYYRFVLLREPPVVGAHTLRRGERMVAKVRTQRATATPVDSEVAEASA